MAASIGSWQRPLSCWNDTLTESILYERYTVSFDGLCMVFIRLKSMIAPDVARIAPHLPSSFPERLRGTPLLGANGSAASFAEVLVKLLRSQTYSLIAAHPPPSCLTHVRNYDRPL